VPPYCVSTHVYFKCEICIFTKTLLVFVPFFFIFELPSVRQWVPKLLPGDKAAGAYLSSSFLNSPSSGNGFRNCYPGIKRPGRGVDHPLLSRAEVAYGTAVRTGQPCRMVQLYVRDSLVVTSVSRIPMHRRFFFTYLFLGAFSKFRKATVSFIMSVCLCLSVRIEQLGFHWTYFLEIWYL
jgi:hypothetical protein